MNDMEMEMRTTRLRWYGFVKKEPDDDWVKLCLTGFRGVRQEICELAKEYVFGDGSERYEVGWTDIGRCSESETMEKWYRVEGHSRWGRGCTIR